MSQNNGHPTYPLMQNAADNLHADSGRPLNEVSLDALMAGDLSADDLNINAETLRAQAAIARQSGFGQLATNLTRAAELTAVPNDVLLQMYETVRPGRASYEMLISMADTLETQYAAPENAKLVREAADVYQARGLLLKE